MTNELLENPQQDAPGKQTKSAKTRAPAFTITALKPRILRSATAIETADMEQPIEGGAVDLDGVEHEVQIGTSANDTLTGSDANDWLDGAGGNDTLDGEGGNDVLYGGTGNDQLFADGGDDFLHGGAGADKLDGGDGHDVASYEGSTAGVSVNLTTGHGSGGDAAGDKLTSIEDVHGSNHRDTLVGDGNDNALYGEGANDRLTGGGGDDLISGGKGKDTANFSGKASDYTVEHLGDGHFTVHDLRGIDGTDTVDSVETFHFADGNVASDKYVNHVPTDLGLIGGKVAENSAADTLVGHMTVKDVDAGDSHTFALLNDAGGRFTIDAATGEIHVADGAVLNYEAAKSHAIDVQVTDADGATYHEKFTVGVTNVNEGPTDLTLKGGAVNENAKAGGVVGTVSTKGPDKGDKFSYSLTDDADGRFTIDAKSGQIKVAKGADLDFEQDADHDVKVQVKDSGGNTYSEAFTIQVKNVNEKPTDLELSGGSVKENSAAGTVVGKVTGTDPDVGDKLTYSLKNSAGGKFAIDAKTGEITVAKGANLDFETSPEQSVTVRVKDAAGKYYDESFKIQIEDVNEGSLDLALNGSSVNENSANGSVVGQVSVTGQSPGAATYSLVDNAGGRFAIDASTGEIRVADGSQLDYENAASHGVTVRVTDAAGVTYDEAFQLQVANVNEAPLDLTFTGNAVNENSANGTVVAQVSVSDQDQGDAHTYALVDDASGRFTIDANTGEIRVADGSRLDYENAASHGVTVRVTDAGGLSYDEAVQIQVNNVNEAPQDLTFSGNAVNENSANGTVVGQVSVSDQDQGDAHTYTLVDDAGGRFTIDANTGEIRVADGSRLDYENAASHGVTVRVTDAGGLSYDEVVQLQVGDVNEAPTDLTLVGDSIDENSAPGTVVGQVTVKDPDSSDAFTFALTDNAQGRFTIDPTTGQLLVAEPVDEVLNYEDNTQHQVTVRVTDAAGNFYDETFTIHVNNVNESVNPVDDFVEGTEDQVIVTGNVLENDYDIDGDELTITDFTTPAHGTVVYNGDGTFSYTPNANFSGADSFQYTVSDGHGMTAHATIHVQVHGDADAATLEVSDATLYAGSSTPLDITAGLGDLDGSETMSIRIENVPEGATLSAGSYQGNGVWNLTSADLAGLQISLPQDAASEIALKVTVVATEADGDQLEFSRDLTLHVSGFQLEDDLGAPSAAFAADDAGIAPSELAETAVTDEPPTWPTLPALNTVDPNAAELVFSELQTGEAGDESAWAGVTSQLGQTQHNGHGSSSDHGHANDAHGEHAPHSGDEHHHASHIATGEKSAGWLNQVGDRFSWLWGMFWAYGGTRTNNADDAANADRNQSGR